MPNWYPIVKVSELPEGQAKQVEAGGRLLAVFKVQGKFYALKDECTHAGGPLSEGFLVGHVVKCPWHAVGFDVRTGEIQGEPAYNNVRAFKTRVVGDEVQVEV